MTTTVFEPRPLPERVARAVRVRIARVHASRPLSTVDPRETIRRVRLALDGLPLELDVYRGGLDLRGAEVDHIWLAVRTRDDPPEEAYVLDAAFPLFHERFVTTLRRFVAGDAGADDLVAAARETGIDERVIGLYPDPMRYRGNPLWASRSLTEVHARPPAAAGP
jgi:hypothetical protein